MSFHRASFLGRVFHVLDSDLLASALISACAIIIAILVAALMVPLAILGGWLVGWVAQWWLGDFLDPFLMFIGNGRIDLPMLGAGLGFVGVFLRSPSK